MDCIEINKKIDDYINDNLTDEEQNEFLHHISICPKCRDELEINVTINKAVSMLENEDINLDLRSFFNRSVIKANRNLKITKIIRAISYSIRSIKFWFILAALIVFIRVIYL